MLKLTICTNIISLWDFNFITRFSHIMEVIRGDVKNTNVLRRKKNLILNTEPEELEYQAVVTSLDVNEPIGSLILEAIRIQTSQ